MSRCHVVTGAASGIGRLVAERLLARGDAVVAIVRSQARLKTVAHDLPGATGQIADLATPARLPDLARELAASYPCVDSLVHAAGAVDLAPVADIDWRLWQQQLDVNLTAPAILTQAFLPALRAARGTLVLVNSGAGLFAHPTWSAYAASKSGLRAFAEALRAEEPEIRVSSVYPGRTATPMQEWVHEQEGTAYDAADWIRPETVADAIVGLIDLPADATISDLTMRPNGR